MKRRALIFLLCYIIGTANTMRAQQTETRRETYKSMFRIYEDNDVINIRGEGKDEGYTNGTRLDWYYIKNKPSRFFIDRLMPKAGDSSINTFSWGIMQVMFTPRDISKRIPDASDYPYSGGLFITHSLHAANPVKKYNLQTEWMLGVMGPPALAKETQKLVHRWIAYTQPRGWDYQLKTDLLLNLNFSAEKELVNINKAIEMIGGAQIFGGTALNGVAVYSIIRFGKMAPYFNGLISQYSSTTGAGARRQIYFFVRPSAEWMMSNALLEGGVFNKNNQRIPENATYNNDGPARQVRVRERVGAKLDYGIVISSGRVGISFTQTTMTPMVKGTRAPVIGNISVHLAW
jgi:lipid A 3-O-deacylase